MKRITFIILFLIFTSSCSDDNPSDRNPFLIEPSFSFDINLNLPLYGSLSTPGNAIYIDNSNVGTRGVIVFNSGFGSFFAWEASCPNHTPNSCSTMAIEGGTNCRCDCEDYLYSLSNGVPLTKLAGDEKLYGLLNYRVDVNDNILVISN